MPDRRAVCIEPTVFVDNRGYFFETYNQNDMHEVGAVDLGSESGTYGQWYGVE